MRPIDADALKIPSEEMIAKMVIDSAPTIDAVSEWIPCSEKLPDRYKRVLTTSKKGMVRENFINAGGWSYDTYSVVAWMPLPAPYKEDKDDE